MSSQTQQLIFGINIDLISTATVLLGSFIGMFMQSGCSIASSSEYRWKSKGPQATGLRGFGVSEPKTYSKVVTCISASQLQAYVRALEVKCLDSSVLSIPSKMNTHLSAVHCTKWIVAESTDATESRKHAENGTTMWRSFRCFMWLRNSVFDISAVLLIIWQVCEILLDSLHPRIHFCRTLWFCQMCVDANVTLLSLKKNIFENRNI